MADEAKPTRSRKQPLERAVAGRDYVVICVSTYPRELAKLDAMVDELKRGGNRKASRSSLIRLAIDKLYHQRQAELGGPDAAE
jgi:hypothetical protein